MRSLIDILDLSVEEIGEMVKYLLMDLTLLKLTRVFQVFLIILMMEHGQ